jgi:mannose-6-phosphate isomerase-like protein (cupin superfamily)
MDALDLSRTYLCLAPSGAVTSIPVTPDFWPTIQTRAELGEGRLVAEFPCKADWNHWEMHPHGEEVLVLLSGEVTFILDEGGGAEGRVRLTAGRACVIPRGTWHRAEVHEPGRLVGVTYGRGTEHRPR